MFRFLMASSLVVALGLSILSAPLPCLADGGASQTDDEGFISMFNGKDLTGWKGGDMSYWSVQDGALVGESTEKHPCPKTQYFWWTEKKPTDFTFTCKFKMIGKGGNSGVQFRSEVTQGGAMMMGPQADMEYGPNWTGCLYHPERFIYVKRGEKGSIAEDGTKNLETFADGNKLLELVKWDQWNTYEIIAKGTEVTLKINGQLMAKVDDHHKNFPPEAGVIGIQLHQGPFMRVEYKDMKIKIEK